MSIWTLLTFAVGILCGILALRTDGSWGDSAMVVALAATLMFASQVLLRGVSRPVV